MKPIRICDLQTERGGIARAGQNVETYSGPEMDLVYVVRDGKGNVTQLCTYTESLFRKHFVTKGWLKQGETAHHIQPAQAYVNLAELGYQNLTPKG